MKIMILLGFCMSPAGFAQKFEGLAMTPPMGWNSWFVFGGSINQKLVHETAEAMAANGMQQAGYVYIVLDDCWSAKERDAKGNLVPDSERFPDGMKALGDFLHKKGFKFGIYGCAGRKTCAGHPGGRGYEFQDARTYASWGVDYLKYDWCETGTADAKETYKTMRDALYEASRPVVFSMCEWGRSKPWEWAVEVAHLWRTAGDIADCWDCRQQYEVGWKIILDDQAALSQYAGPDHWNDPDILAVGRPGLTVEESRAHFSLWCILAAPLMAGNDVRNMMPEIRDILTDAEVIAIDQDPLGRQGYRFSHESGREVWVKELAGGEWAVCVLNSGDKESEVRVAWADLTFLKGIYRVRDVWGKKDVGTTEQYFAGTVDSRDVVLFRLKPAGAAK